MASSNQCGGTILGVRRARGVDTPSRGYGGVFLGSLPEKAPGSLSKSCRDSAGRSTPPHVLRFRTGATGPKVKVRCKMCESYCRPLCRNTLTTWNDFIADGPQSTWSSIRETEPKPLGVWSCAPARVVRFSHYFRVRASTGDD